MTRRLVAAAAAALLLAGCSGTSGDLTARAQKVLVPAVQQVREAAAGGGFSAVQAAVKHLDRLVEREQRAGQVSADRATEIEDAADAVLAQVSPEPSPSSEPSTSSSPSRSPSPSPSPTSDSPTPTPTTPPPTTAPPSQPSSPSPSQSPSADVTVTVP